MKVEDIKQLNIGETVVIKDDDGDIKGLVRGIDTWALMVRVEIDDHTCTWLPPTIIKRYTE